MTLPKPRLLYFGYQGRAEPIRITLAAAGVEFEQQIVEGAEVKRDLGAFHFGQVPWHIARKHGLYGHGVAEQARVDEVMEGCNDVVQQLYSKCINKGGPAARENYFVQHVLAASAAAATAKGAHTAFLSRLLAASGSGWFVESGLTVADISAAVVVSLHLRIYGRDRFAGQWPTLVALHDRVMALPRIAAYRQGPQCLPVVSPGLP
ncbi:hypothetical protein ABPG75_009337 [Micractinium tetrahymenae]